MLRIRSQKQSCSGQKLAENNMKPEEFFPKMLGIPQTGTIFTEVIDIFDRYIMDQFSFTPEELFRIDAE